MNLPEFLATYVNPTTGEFLDSPDENITAEKLRKCMVDITSLLAEINPIVPKVLELGQTTNGLFSGIKILSLPNGNISFYFFDKQNQILGYNDSESGFVFQRAGYEATTKITDIPEDGFLSKAMLQLISDGAYWNPPVSIGRGVIALEGGGIYGNDVNNKLRKYTVPKNAVINAQVEDSEIIFNYRYIPSEYPVDFLNNYAVQGDRFEILFFADIAGTAKFQVELPSSKLSHTPLVVSAQKYYKLTAEVFFDLDSNYSYQVFASIQEVAPPINT